MRACRVAGKRQCRRILATEHQRSIGQQRCLPWRRLTLGVELFAEAQVSALTEAHMTRRLWSQLISGAIFLSIACSALSDVSILVREELGLDRLGSTSALLMQNGPAVSFDGGLYQASYIGNLFQITVEQDVAGGLPFGFAAYRSSYTPLAADDPNVLAFIPVVGDLQQGQVLSETITPVPEPALWGTMALGLLGQMVWIGVRGRGRRTRSELTLT